MPQRNLKFPFFLSGQLWKFLQNTLCLLDTSNLITLITESELFASFCLSHLITPSSLPPRKPVKSAAWGLQAKILWGISEVCSLSAIVRSSSKVITSSFLKKKEGKKEGKNHTNLNDFLQLVSPTFSLLKLKVISTPQSYPQQCPFVAGAPSRGMAAVRRS